MSEPNAQPHAPDPPYKSSHRQLSVFERLTGRDSAGRFLPKWSGAVCDWWGCDDPIEGPRRRFCPTHRRAHGQRLLGQLHAAAASAGLRR